VTSLDTLLEVQDHDTTLDRLRHRRGTLPELAQLADIEARTRVLDDQTAALGAQRDEVVSRQEKHEAELKASEARVVDLEHKMYSGAVTATRDLMAMTDEVSSVRKRCSGLEDLALEAIMEREQLEGELGVIDDQRQELAADAAQVRASLEAEQAKIDAETAVEQSARAGLAEGLPPELISDYERLRQRLDGIGAARLASGSCTGCHLTLPATEIDRIKHLDPSVVVYCDQCGRILIRS
jgi:predicted  nucleic acid-binding Zn-ribbon protein